MGLRLTKWWLGPVLLLQGIWVRKRTPTLPEPCDQKTGVVGTGMPLRLLVLGDSSAAGVGANVASESLLGQLLASLSPNHEVHFQLLAKTGFTTANVISQLQDSQPQAFDVVVTALGVNDVTSQVAPTLWREQQALLLSLIKQLFKPKQIIASGLPPVAEFPALPWPLNAYLGQHANLLNLTLEQLVASDDRVHFMSLRDFPESAQPASDGFHPGPSVYRLWAAKIYAVLEDAPVEL